MSNPYPAVYAAAVAGVLFWALLYMLYRFTNLEFRHVVAFVFIVGLICRIALSLATPNFYAPDEEPHFRYVQYLYDNHKFPEMKPSDLQTATREFYQPPLYYMAALPLYAASHAISGGNVSVDLRVVRMLSIVLWIISTAFYLKTLRRLQLNDPFIEAGVISVLCLLPAYMFISSVMNNDNMAMFFGGPIFYMLAGELKEHDFKRRRAVVMGLLLGLAVMSKLSGAIYVIAFVLVLAARAIAKALSGVSLVRSILIAMAIFFLVVGPWTYRNAARYGELTAENTGNIPARFVAPAVPTTTALVQSVVQISTTFWSAAGATNNIQFGRRFAQVLTALIVIGLLVGVSLRLRTLRRVLFGSDAVFLICTAILVLVNLALVMRFGLLFRQGQGRHMFTVVLPIAILSAIGIRCLTRDRMSPGSFIHPAGFFVTYALAYFAYCIMSFP